MQISCAACLPYLTFISTFSPLAFLAALVCVLTEFAKMLGTITGVTDTQQPCSWLEKAISSLCVLGVSELKKKKVDSNTPFRASDFNAIRFQEICLSFLKIKQLIAKMGIQGKKGNSLQQKCPDFKGWKKIFQVTE